jgi:fumarylacetoacetase
MTPPGFPDTVDATHDPDRRSWVASADGHADFPIQNLPLGVFSPAGARPRVGIAIGDAILDVAAAHQAGLFPADAARAAGHASASSLNALLAEGREARVSLRRRVADLLTTGAPEQATVERLLYAAADCALHLPAQVGDYTDFYAGIHHATNVGRQFRPDQPLLPNYKHVPIGYHGRSSSVCVSGTPVRRPSGQRKARPADDAPVFAPSQRLDFELELGVWIGEGNALGAPVPIERAEHHIAGFGLLNDWSARDIQAWEYQPLGPFLSKSFATSVSPWVITPEALAPFRVAPPPRPGGDPAPLPYLTSARDQQDGGYDIALEVLLLTPCLRERGAPPHCLSRSNTQHLYWTVGQLVAHHTSNGCNLRPGDLFGSGTISSPDPGGLGSLLEITEGGRRPVTLASGSTRTFLEDGDEIIFRAVARRDGYVPIGFGEVRGTIVSAHRTGKPA